MKGQFAVEHMMVVGFSILIIIPVIYMFYTYSSSQTEDLMVQRINDLGNEVIDNAESIYYMGPPAKITIKENFPEKLRSVEVSSNNKELIFYFGQHNSSIPFLSEIPLDGIYFEEVGQDCDENAFRRRTCFSQGMKHITLKAMPNNTSIIIE